MFRRSVRLAATLAIAVAACTCAGDDYYRLYLAEHPGWTPEFPPDPISLDALIAIVHAPATAPRTTLQVTHARVIGLGTEPWEVFEARDVRSGALRADPDRFYIVAARIECNWMALSSSRSHRWQGWAFNWYVLRNAKLVSYDHARFEEGCKRVDDSESTMKLMQGFEDRVWELLVQRQPVERPES